jgi:c-di-GMP-binding flagellar brake protein YcgR
MSRDPSTRQHARVTLLEDAQYITGNRQKINATLLDLSVSGAALMTDQALPVSELFDVCFEIEDADYLPLEIKVKARVKHTRHDPQRMCGISGLQFEGLDDATVILLDAFVERQLGLRRSK